MAKFTTRDNKNIRIKVDDEDDELMKLLNDAVPRLSYDEILDGELEKRLAKTDIGTVKLSAGDDVKQLIFSLAMFNTISKPPGF
jgi:hypothetical protein